MKPPVFAKATPGRRINTKCVRKLKRNILIKAIIFISIVLVLSGCMANKTGIERIDKTESGLKVIKVGDTSEPVANDEPPYLIKRVQPVYPIFPQKHGIQGEVWLKVEILADGSVGAIEVSKSILPGPGGLDESAINAVKQWKYSPAKREGKPVACWITFPVTFELK